MREYYEGIEIVPEGQIADFIRLDVTGMNKDEAKTLIQKQMSGKIYDLNYHICGHEDRKPCQLIKL